MSSFYIIKELFIYPIKSLAGISCQSLIAQEMGFENDRRWMLLDQNNQMITQRENPIMSQFYPKIAADKIEISYHENSHSFLMEAYFGDPIQSNVWDDACTVFEVNENTSKWFSEQLGFDCKLVKVVNLGDRKHESSTNKTIDNVSLADSYPYLLVGTKSLDFLNEKLSYKITIHRFRPNIVIETQIPHEEDDFENFSINDIQFQNIKPCARCIMVNHNPSNGLVKKEPLKILSTYRNRNNAVFFATNVRCLNSGEIKVGDVLDT